MTRMTMRTGMIVMMALALGGCDEPARADSQAFACRVDADDLGDAHPGHARWRDALARVATEQRLPGAVLVIRDRDGLWAGAVGTADAEVGAPMRACQPTRIASVTKIYVAALALQLAESGALDLDRTVDDLLGGRYGDVPNTGAATVRDLLANESGIPDYVDTAFVLAKFDDPWRTWTVDEAIARLAGRAPLFPAGTSFAYSNTGFLLAGKIVERAGGAPLSAQLAARVLEPLGLRSTDYTADRTDFDGVARGHFDLLGNGELVDSTESYANSVFGADGGLVTTGYDLRRFLDALLRERVLVSDAAVAAMTDFDDPRRDPTWTLAGHDGYGLGLIRWRTDSGAVGWGHSGDEFGYQAAAWYFPAEDVTFVFLVNGSSLVPAGDNLTARIERATNELVALALAGD